MARRLLNVVMKKLQYGVIPGPPPVYSLRRIDPIEFLFYPSTLEAHAAAVAAAAATAKAKKDGSSPRGTPPPWMESMSPMPEPEPGFLLSSSTDYERLSFLPFYGRDSGGGASKMLCADQAGHAVIYDADAGCFEVVPSFNRQMCLKSSYGISYLLTRAGAAAAAGSDPRRGETLYVMEERHVLNYCVFEALVYSDPASEYSHRRNIDRPNSGAGKKGWRWNRLPSPRRAGTDIWSFMRSAAVRCHTLADIGRDTAICVSITDDADDNGGEGSTHYFNTSTQRWTKAGDWMLPFRGRAVHIPELGGLWFGLGHEHPHHLCAMDLSSSFHEKDISSTPAAPELLYKWPHPTLPKEWSMVGSNLVYLGDGRFCIAKTFELSEKEDVIRGRKEMTVISGVEVVRAGPTSSKLRMVKHKSRFYDFDGDSYTRDFIHRVLKIIRATLY